MNTRMKRSGLLLVILLAFVLLATTAAAAGHIALQDPIPEPIATGALRIRLEPVATGMTSPNWGTAIPACGSAGNRLAVTDQDGILWGVDLGSGEKTVLLDVSDRLVALGVGGPGTYDERGLLGVAFHPDYSSNGLLYIYTSEPVDGPADFSTMPTGTTPNNQSVVSEWQVPSPCDAASVVDPASRRELLRIDQPQFNHAAGALSFGSDEMLYVSLGDGGAADDQGVGHVEGGNAQDPSNILGNILRIDPDGRDSANGQYGIPADNPFVATAGYLDEIYAYGFRNPFRFSFDSHTGEMWIADVGQNDIEEVDLGIAGGNYGWRIKEGAFCFDPNGTEPGFVYDCAPGDVPPGLIEPVAQYDHDEGIAIVGGFVYRGSEIPPLRGRYVFGDFLHPASGSGRLFYLQRNQEILEFQYDGKEGLGLFLLGFGQDAQGEIYVLANQTLVPFGNTGTVLRMEWGQPRSTNFAAHLSGDQEVPAVETRAQGQANFKFADDLSSMEYRLNVTNIEDVVASHIHCAVEGANGPVGVTLFSGGPLSPRGVLAEGTAAAPDPANACGWQSLSDVFLAIEGGQAYVNVHTLAHRPGEIRGQID